MDNNNIPIGYKQTKLGIIPEDWKLKRLGELGGFSKGKGITKAQLVENGFYAIRYGELYTKHNILIKEFFSFINADTAKSSIQIKNNDILFAGSGETLNEIGKCATYIGSDIVYAGGDIIILSPNRDIDSLYLSFSLNSDIVLRQRRKLGQGHSVVHIYPSGLETLPIPLPPLPEQKAIAKILSTWDKAINNYQLLIDKYKLKKKALMQQLLKPKEDWKEVKLGALCSRIGDGIHSTPKYDNYGEYYFINGNNLNNGEIIIDKKTKRVSKYEFNKHKREINNNVTILLSINGTIGNLAFYNDENIILGKSAAYINVNSEVKKLYLFYELKSERIRNYFQNELTGSTIKNLSLKSIRNTPIYLPKISVQTKIANILSSADKEISILEQQLSAVKEQKKGLMQVLLTGKKRVLVN